jgi:hypothetical protein
MVTFSASNYTIILPLLSCFIFALISAFVILAQCGGSKGKKVSRRQFRTLSIQVENSAFVRFQQVGQQAAPRQPQKPGQQRPGPAPLGQPKPGTAAQKGKPTAKPAWTAKEKTKTASTAKKLGGKKDKKATIPTTGKKTADPKFGAIDSDLVSSHEHLAFSCYNRHVPLDFRCPTRPPICSSDDQRFRIPRFQKERKLQSNQVCKIRVQSCFPFAQTCISRESPAK